MLLFSTFTWAAPAGWFSAEARGNYLMIAPEELNSYHRELFSYSFGIETENTVLSEMGCAEAVLNYGLAEGADVYLKLGISAAYLTDILHDEFHDKDVITSNISLNILYAGIGARHVPAEFFGTLRPYIGADAGIFYAAVGSWEVTADGGAYFVADGYENQKTDFSGAAFFGANFEAGFEWRIFEKYGITAYGGYRAAAFKFDFSQEGLFGDAHYKNPAEADLSGFYFGGGISYAFNTEEELPLPDDMAETALWKKHESEGDSLFAKKEYMKAASSYTEALKAGGDFSLYKKLSACFFRLNDIARTKKWADMYIKYHPEDAAFAAWAEKLKIQLPGN